jgi:hypothetical protein
VVVCPQATDPLLIFRKMHRQKQGVFLQPVPALGWYRKAWQPIVNGNRALKSVVSTRSLTLERAIVYNESS